MMRFWAAVLLVLAAAMWSVCPSPTFASDAPVLRVPEIVARAAELDGHEVTFEGEAIGEALRADDATVWVNVLDGGKAIGVWMPEEMASQIVRYGAYSQTGDTVRITGTVNLACDQHGGDLDVHAASLEVVADGKPRSERVRPLEALVGAAGFAIAGMAALLARSRERRRFEERQ
ncbi:hypothetical protein MX659_02035 [Coriobacteriia bacterium Es71-Z0120]|uniref:hypothetical protein n=1 Tax=Parvivirga hydrogeniphila TaxID=2939460 RepID=UPI002260C315|nr:hypothetical protein [Parvivirga hydrogeniphila]MCL4078387.1 hypothetical protein [Parvivirga hydrogeniphila]